MSELDSIITVNISRETTVPTRAGFGYGNFLSNDAAFLERVKFYGSSAEVAADAAAGADTAAFAAAYFGQTIRPTRLYVSKKGRDLANVTELKFTGSFVASNTIDLTIDGVPMTQVVYAGSHATTLTDIAAEIQGEATIATATSDGIDTITITGAAIDTDVVYTALVIAAGASQPTGAFTVTQYQDAVLTNTASLVAAENINNDWYALASYDHSDAGIEEIADYAQTRTKIYGFASSSADILTTAGTDVFTSLKGQSHDRTFGVYSADAASFPEAAWMGGLLPKDPGSITWAYKPLKGIAVDTLTTSEQANALANGANIYISKAGVNHTEFGQMAEGEFIDIIRGADFIQIRIQEEVFTNLVNSDKIPYTDAGVAVIESAIRGVLTLATNQGILAGDPAYTVTVPLVASVSIVDKGNRFLPDVEFEGTLAGAIHKTTISGVLTL